MSTLRVTFLSSLILELVATVSVALVAVAIGLRLLDGHLDSAHGAVRARARPGGLPPAAPARGELPRKRRGRGAAEQVFALLERPSSAGWLAHRRARPGRRRLALEGLRVTIPVAPRRRSTASRSRSSRARCSRSSARAGAASRRCSACCSASSRPSAARCASATSTSTELDLAAWRAPLAWVPQRPHLFAALDRRERPSRAAATPSRTEVARGARRRRPRRGRRRLPRGLDDRARRPRARGSRPASASASRWPARSCATRRCCCSTSRPRTSTARPRRMVLEAVRRPAPRAAPSCSSPTARRCVALADRVFRSSPR